MEEVKEDESYAAVTVAKAALCEAGHPELAAMVRANKEQMPTIESDEAHRAFRQVIARAFLMGHLAAGHDDRMTRSIDLDFEWVDSIDCVLTHSAQGKTDTLDS